MHETTIGVCQWSFSGYLWSIFKVYLFAVVKLWAAAVSRQWHIFCTEVCLWLKKLAFRILLRILHRNSSDLPPLSSILRPSSCIRSFAMPLFMVNGFSSVQHRTQDRRRREYEWILKPRKAQYWTFQGFFCTAGVNCAQAKWCFFHKAQQWKLVRFWCLDSTGQLQWLK